MAKETSLQKHESESIEAERMREGPVFVPHVDIIEEKNRFLILADMPGVNTGDVDIRYERGQLSIHGKIEQRQQPEKAGPVVREYGVGDFYRSFKIGEGIDDDGITAEMNQGVLALNLPKSEKARPRRIEVKTS